MVSSTSRHDRTASALRFFDRWALTFTVIWLGWWGTFVLYKYGWPWEGGGLLGVLLAAKLSDVGDFLAGVVAVPAFLWLVLAYQTQKKELIASVDALVKQEGQLEAQAIALARQSAVMEKQLDQLMRDRDARLEPIFMINMAVAVLAGDQRELMDRVEWLKSGKPRGTWIISLYNEGTRVEGVEVSVRTGKGSRLVQWESQDAEVINDEHRTEIEIREQDGFPRDFFLDIQYICMDGRVGRQTHSVSSTGLRKRARNDQELLPEPAAPA